MKCFAGVQKPVSKISWVNVMNRMAGGLLGGSVLVKSVLRDYSLQQKNWIKCFAGIQEHLKIE